MKKELNNRYSKGFGEIKLFREMSDILRNTYNVSFVKETHRHYISFNSKSINKRVRREISDLWIIMYSKKRKIAKMTFLQAKLHKSKTYFPFRFTGDFFQHELLSMRPNILNIGKRFNLPSNILSFTANESVGTYGIFYFDQNSQIDFAFTVASLLKPNKIGTANKQTSTSFVFPNINNDSCLFRLNKFRDIDILATLNIDCFTHSMLNLRIGAELHTNYGLLSIVGGILRNSSASDDLAVTEFLESFDASSNDSTDNVSFSNIMLINIDSNNKE